LLVLEPQPYKSYKNAINKPGVKDAAFADLDQIRLRPEQFAEYLVQQVGFQLVQRLSAVSEAAGAEAVSVKGFDRPILVLRKPAAAAGQAAAATGAH
jgi:7SK snRNA methylphosphate capping enzyme